MGLERNPAGLTCGSLGFQLNRKGTHISPSNPAGLTCGSLGFLPIVGGLAEIGTIPRASRRSIAGDTQVLKQGLESNARGAELIARNPGIWADC